MEVTHLTNTSLWVKFKSGKTLLTDPWFIDGINFGTWNNYPKPSDKQRQEWLNLRPDYIYISHFHEDHCDLKTLNNLKCDPEIWIGYFSNNVLKGKLNDRKLRVLQMYEITSVDKLKVSILPDYQCTSMGLEDKVNFQVDSSLYVQDEDGESLLDINDNPMQLHHAKEFVSRFGNPTWAAIPSTTASCYPWAFDYSEKEKEARWLVLKKNICKKATDIATELGAKHTIFFKRGYELVGAMKNIEVNYYEMCGRAAKNVQAHQKKLSGDCPDWKVSINDFEFSLAGTNLRNVTNWIQFNIKKEVLLMILTRSMDWNIAELGCMMEIRRKPDRYMPTIHSLMSYFHL